MKDLYLILHVARTATPEEIRSAYRRRALELHPDKSGADSEPFLELQRAYSVLSDPTQRAAYDHQAESPPARRGRVRMQQPPEPFRQVEHRHDLREIWLARSHEDIEPSFEDVFDHLFGNPGFLTPLTNRSIGQRECWRCQNSGVITVACPVDVAFPPRLLRQHIVRMDLDHFGIRNLHLTFCFRPETPFNRMRSSHFREEV